MPDATHLSAWVTVLAILFYFWTVMNVGRMRQKHGVKAPAVTGHLEFECALRVQMNTLEAMPVFLPLLWLATLYFTGPLPAVFGLLWVLGRFLYMQGYMSAPEKRELGFGVQSMALLGLLVLTAWGLLT